MPTIAETLTALNLTLPPAPKPVAAYIPFVRTGNLVFISGQLPSRDGKVLYTGPVPSACSPEDAKQAAQLCILNALAILSDACGGGAQSLDKVARIIRIGVFVQSDNAFPSQPAIANGASELLVSLFGDSGKHARAAVGTNALPLNATVEIELLAELK
jgi:enamine deaminase RidA (YjgF/YER057c/UK114 family)